MPTEIAYSIAFLLGLAWVVLGSSRFVFGGQHSVKRLVLFAIAYLCIYFIGRLTIVFFNAEGPIELGILTVTLLAVTTPLSFLAGKLILKYPLPAHQEHEEGPS